MPPAPAPAATPVAMKPEDLTKALDDILKKYSKESLDEWDFKHAYEEV